MCTIYPPVSCTGVRNWFNSEHDRLLYLSCMQGLMNPRILGATAVGLALVGAAYTLASFAAPAPISQQANVNRAPEAPPRSAIAVTDADGNGIEDWRDEYITTEPIILTDATSTPYTPPETLTGQMGINFLQNVILAKGYGEFGRSEEEVITDTAETVMSLAQDRHQDTLHDTPDITIMREWDDEDIRNYANTVAAILYRNSMPDMEGELFILHDILRNNNDDRVAELEQLAGVYAGYRDETLQVPVPAFLVKEHLDLINTYHALHYDIDAMTEVVSDPVVSMLRLKRYEDDARGLGLALQNMYLALEPHAELFTVEDPAAVFVAFSPDFQMN